ncbi:MAG: CheR family methyltransferase, partial [Thermodesulfobacteriota bacterium]
PTHVSIMPELIRRYTSMPVVHATDGTKVKPDNIYIVPPNREIAILNATLQLMEPQEIRSVRKPIDFFFRTLAQDQRDKAIGIVLSGMGTDGTLGLREIKGEMGLTLVQAPESAKFDGMPSTAAATGLIDFVLPPEKMPECLITYARQSGKKFFFRISKNHTAVPHDLQKIFILLRTHTGHDFSHYKSNTIIRRIERRMNLHHLDSLQKYIRFLHENPQEIHSLFKEMLIGVTNFFRDPEAFEVLKKKVLPGTIRRKTQNHSLRVWVPGCSTGEEAYSIGILISECQKEMDMSLDVQIFATDIDMEAIETARKGSYPESILVDVNPSRLKRFFIKENDTYRIGKEIREMVVFAPQNILKDPPFTKLDLICCRNLLIYLDATLQKRLLPLFHYALNPEGTLFLGSSEAVGSQMELFTALDRKWKIFKRRSVSIKAPDFLEFPIVPPVEKEMTMTLPNNPAQTITQVAEKALIESFAPPSAIVNEKGEILFVHGRTGMYLEPAPGEAKMNIVEMAREGLKTDLMLSLHRAATGLSEVVTENLEVKTNGETRRIRLRVRPISASGTAPNFFLVSFEAAESMKKVTRKSRASKRTKDESVEKLEKELQYTKESLQTTIEELETANEELKSTNEELQSTNEELQSANEELETSKEEQQSLNEELVTVNTELHGKIEELSRTNNDMRNLMDSLEIPTLFLDNEMRVKRFTSHIARVIRLIDSDRGRLISDIASTLKQDTILTEIESVIRTLVPREVAVQSVEDRWYLMRILPYRTLENVIEGVVITFLDVDVQKKAEERIDALNKALQDAKQYAESIIETLREPLVVLAGDLKIISANRTFYQKFSLKPESTVGRFIFDLEAKLWDIPELRKLLEETLSENSAFDDYLIEQKLQNGTRRKFRLNARKLLREKEKKELILLAMEDVSGSA